MRSFNKNLENKIILDTYWRVQLICMEDQTHSSLEPTLVYNQTQTPLINQVMNFLTILRVTEILCSFRLVQEGKAGRRIPETSKLEFL